MNRTPAVPPDGSEDPSAEVSSARSLHRRNAGYRKSLIANESSVAGRDSLQDLADAVKAEIRRRFAQGERPAVAEYLERYPALRDVSDRVLSLVYEEYCLLEETGEAVDPDEFCDRYPAWRDSLESQLRYHRIFSQAVAPSSPKPRFPKPGDRFQGFRLNRELGRGGVARVFLAHEEELGEREVAIKISPDRGVEPAIHGRLDHPQIVPVLSVVHESETGLRGLCMPYWPGVSLDTVIAQLDPVRRSGHASGVWDVVLKLSTGEGTKSASERGPGWADFPANGTFYDACAWIVAQLSDGLAYAHSRAVLHRDIKPANVLMTLRGGPLLLDFNLAHDPSALDQAEAALQGGTLPYMAPEQLRAFLDPGGWDKVSVSADIYSLGLVLRELLTGERPEPPDRTISIARSIQDLYERRSRPLGSMRTRARPVPHALCAIVNRCLAVVPGERYPHASVLADDLRRFIHRLPLHGARNPSLRERTRNWVWRRRRPIAALVLIGGIAGANALIAARTARVSGREHLDLGARAIHARNLAEARDQYAKAIALDPSLFAAELGLGHVDLLEGKYEEAWRHCTDAIRHAEGPPLRASGEQLARAYYSRADAALLWSNILLKRLAAKPASASDGVSQSAGVDAEAAVAQEKLANAEADLRRARAETTDSYAVTVCDVLDARRLAGLGDLALRNQDFALARSSFEQAEAYLRDVLDRVPGHVAARRVQANVELSLGSLDEAEKRFAESYRRQSQAIALAEAPPRILEGPARARVYSRRAQASLSWGDADRLVATREEPKEAPAGSHYREAVQDVERARGISQDHETLVTCGMIAARAQCGLGDLASRRDRYHESCTQYEEAEREIARVIALAPHRQDALALRNAIRERLANDRKMRAGGTPTAMSR